MSEVILLKKLSAKAIMGSVKMLALDTFYLERDIKKPNPEAPKGIPLFTVFGVTSGVKTGNTDNGDWLSFEGDFKAFVVDMKTGETTTYRGPRLFISEPAQSLIEGALTSSDAVEVSFAISIVPSENAYGYEYRASPLLELQESDAITALQEKLMAKYGGGNKYGIEGPKTKAIEVNPDVKETTVEPTETTIEKAAKKSPKKTK